MKKSFALTILASMLLGGVAVAQTTVNPTPPGPAMPNAANSTSATTNSMPMTPPEKFTVTNYYNQDVYDPNDSKIGSIEDVLIDNTNSITA
jgi:PRC-barrel domain